MRFSSLSLERYGRFENCELKFRTGSPDLHIVYGANEAGKTTSLAAVSDLLFGFPARSPYNFVFDYALLRVGAVLEDEGHSLACRRKKGTSNTLLDAQDQPLDEGQLLAMLRGQTRETFGLSFSLDQDGLRAGGQAMVDARNDLGRALFAAGSGLTGVSDELTRLEAEADAIWGQRAAARRSFTQVQRELEAQSRAVRDEALKPKAWLDAKAAVADAQAVLEETQRRRDEVLAKVSQVERTRRTAPAVRLRAAHLEALGAYTDTVDIAPQREDGAETAMQEAQAASRAKAAAETLAQEARNQMIALTPDQLVLARSEELDELVSSAGAVEKGRRDMVRLAADLVSGETLIGRLREEAGAIAAAPPTRIVSSKLREAALGHVENQSALRQIEQSEDELGERRSGLAVKAASSTASRDLAALTSAINLAKALGADVDGRCEAAQRIADRSASALEQALARLAPWSGDAETLLALPRLAPQEIDQTRATLSELTADMGREQSAGARAREEAAALALEMEHLSSGTAVSAEDMAAARNDRDNHWQPLRAHILRAAPLPSADEAVTAFEVAIAGADDRSDLRFAAADESSRLTDMGQRRARALLAGEQADMRMAAASERREAMRVAWTRTLTDAGYPDLEPGRFLGWMIDRDSAVAAHQEVLETADAARTLCKRRDEHRAVLAAELNADPGAPGGSELAPILTFAEQIRQDCEAVNQERQLNEAALAQIDQDLESLQQRRRRVEEVTEAWRIEWRGLLSETGIHLDITGATATLDILDELRAAISTQTELQARVDGMARDAREHDERVAVVADALGITSASDGTAPLDLMRARLAAARSTAKALATLEESAANRNAEAAAEDARREAAWGSLAALLEETGSADAADLGMAIERSRAARALRTAVAEAEIAITSAGDGKSLEDLVAALDGIDIDNLAARSEALAEELAGLNDEVAVAAGTHGDARRAFASLETQGEASANAASDAAQARAELSVLAEHYILKRAQAVTLRWAIEQYREQHQDPMLLRAGELFRTLTVGRYVNLKIDNDGATPRLLGLRDDGRTVVEVGAMSEGTTDQLFLALRLAAVEQSVASGVRLPFLADDLFVNFDDERSEAGFRVLAELARSTQVLFFTHHPHLAAIARSVVGDELHSESALG